MLKKLLEKLSDVIAKKIEEIARALHGLKNEEKEP